MLLLELTAVNLRGLGHSTPGVTGALAGERRAPRVYLGGDRLSLASYVVRAAGGDRRLGFTSLTVVLQESTLRVAFVDASWAFLTVTNTYFGSDGMTLHNTILCSRSIEGRLLRAAIQGNLKCYFKISN